MIKRILLLLTLFIGVNASAQVLKYRTVAFAENQYNYNTQRWSGWSDWASSNMLLTIDLQQDIVKIYSPVIQTYKIFEAESNFYDSDGDLNLVYRMYDQDYDRGKLRLLQRTSGSSEVYIEFADIKWCYSVRKL